MGPGQALGRAPSRARPRCSTRSTLLARPPPRSAPLHSATPTLWPGNTRQHSHLLRAAQAAQLRIGKIEGREGAGAGVRGEVIVMWGLACALCAVRHAHSTALYNNFDGSGIMTLLGHPACSAARGVIFKFQSKYSTKYLGTMVSRDTGRQFLESEQLS